MKIEAICTLKYGDDCQAIEIGDKLKFSLKNGEILIGECLSYDRISISIDRQFCTEIIEFDTIENIEILEKIKGE